MIIKLYTSPIVNNLPIKNLVAKRNQISTHVHVHVHDTHSLTHTPHPSTCIEELVVA